MTPPLYHEDGSLIVFNPTFSEVETHASFTAADVRIHTCIMRLGWVGVNRYDYSLTDRVLKEVFENGKAEYFIPRITLNVPVEWCRENPEEITVFHNGPRDVEEIHTLVGTLRHDYLGYRSEKGYYNSNGWQDTRPNMDCLISRQSFSSKKWIEDASEALKRLIDRIESSPYGDRILAYHIAYGACGESMMWGRQSSSMWGDYGISHQRHFYNYAIEKYGSREKILAAWGLTSLDGDIVPPPSLREKTHSKADDFYRDEAANKTELEGKITEAQATFKSAIDNVAKDLAAVEKKLADAIASGDAALSSRISSVSTSLRAARTALEKADADNKAELIAKIEAAEATLDEAIKAVQKNLDDAKAELEKALADGDKANADALAQAISDLNAAIDAAEAAAATANDSLKSELTSKIDNADAALEAAIDALAGELDSIKQKTDELQAFTIIVCVISCVSLCGCCAFVVWFFIDRKKRI